jgi:hypothetical protein
MLAHQATTMAHPRLWDCAVEWICAMMQEHTGESTDERAWRSLQGKRLISPIIQTSLATVGFGSGRRLRLKNPHSPADG